ncbi:MAG TPA: hypothetical protein VN682_16925 [Terriglobales bacterium]|nr:hypothetical protein [Terriglobales bacterium]
MTQSNPKSVEGARLIEVKFERNAWQIYNNGWLLGGDFASKEAAEQWMAHFRSPKAALSAAAPRCNRCAADLCEHDNCTDWTCARACGKCAPGPVPARDGVREAAQSTKEYAEQCARDLLTRLFNEHYGSGEAKWFRHALRRNLEPMLVKELLLWADAYWRARMSNRPQVDCYRELLKEREGNPCTPEEQLGQWREPEQEEQADGQ